MSCLILQQLQLCGFWLACWVLPCCFCPWLACTQCSRSLWPGGTDKIGSRKHDCCEVCCCHSITHALGSQRSVDSGWRQNKAVKRPALRAVLHALAMDTPSPDRTLDAEAFTDWLTCLQKFMAWKWQNAMQWLKVLPGGQTNSQISPTHRSAC